MLNSAQPQHKTFNVMHPPRQLQRFTVYPERRQYRARRKLLARVVIGDIFGCCCSHIIILNKFRGIYVNLHAALSPTTTRAAVLPHNSAARRCFIIFCVRLLLETHSKSIFIIFEKFIVTQQLFKQ